MSEIAFHEKASRSQVSSCAFFLFKVFLLPSWPLSPCFHSHSRGATRFARCRLGVLGSAGAALCLAPCGSAVREWNLGQAINAVTGTRLWLLSFFSWNRFVFTQPPQRSPGGCCATGRTLLHSPTSDAVTPPAFSQSPRWLAFFRFFLLLVELTSAPSAADHSRLRMVP